VTVAMLLALGKVMPPEGKPLPYPPAKWCLLQNALTFDGFIG
jgi:hypothetical protein